MGSCGGFGNYDCGQEWTDRQRDRSSTYFLAQWVLAVRQCGIRFCSRPFVLYDDADQYLKYEIVIYLTANLRYKPLWQLY